MKRILVRIAASVLAFFFGVAAHKAWSIFHPAQSVTTSPLTRDEEWHRFYEAAEMTGNQDVRIEVENRLMCTSRAGVPDAWRVEIGNQARCWKSDSTMHELILSETSEYGSFFIRFKKSHQAWIYQNLDFIKTVSTGPSAKAYVSSHKWLLGVPHNSHNE